MKKMLGSHEKLDSEGKPVVDRDGRRVVMAILDCGHEVPYREVVFVDGVGEAKCPSDDHDESGMAPHPPDAPKSAPPPAEGESSPPPAAGDATAPVPKA